MRQALVSWLYPQSLPSQDLFSSFLVDVSMCTKALEPMVLGFWSRLLPMDSLVQGPHVERRVRCPSRQVRRGEYQLPPNEFREHATCQ